MNKPLVSIIMSVYNDASYIGKAIDSVLTQTYTNWEFIIIDDSSNDKSKELILNYLKKEKRIRLLQNDKQKGLIKNLNTGIKLAKGKYIARIDSDDIWSNLTKLEKQISLLEENADYSLVGSWAKVVDQKGKEISKLEYPINDSDIRDYILIEDCFIHSSVVFRKSILAKIGDYDSNYQHAEDYNLWLRMGSVSKFCNIPEYLVKYRLNPLGVTKTKYHAQIKNSIKSVNSFKNLYPHYAKAVFLWNLREYVPDDIKKKISALFKGSYRGGKSTNYA